MPFLGRCSSAPSEGTHVWSKTQYHRPTFFFSASAVNRSFALCLKSTLVLMAWLVSRVGNSNLHLAGVVVAAAAKLVVLTFVSIDFRRGR